MKEMFTANKILSFYDDAKKIVKGEFPVPRHALIYPSYACNHKCSFCLYDDWIEPKDFIPTEEFRKIINELADMGVESVEFCGGGEPTMHPEFAELVKIMKARNLEIGIITNGSMIWKYYELMVDFTWVRVSIDTADPELYAKLHGIKPEALPKILSGIKKLTDHRKEVGSKLDVGIKSMLTKHDISIEALVQMRKDCGADYNQFKSVRASSDEPTEAQVKFYKDKIASLGDLMVKDGLSKSYATTNCFMTPIHTMIDAYGDVYLCCYFHYREDNHRIGNIFNNTFKEIWYSDEHWRVINQVKQKECNKYDCRWHEYNRIMEGVLKNNDHHLKFI